jgi:hypothetical protein
MQLSFIEPFVGTGTKVATIVPSRSFLKLQKNLANPEY